MKRAVSSWRSIGVPCENSESGLPSLFCRPRCRRRDLPSREAAVTEGEEGDMAAATVAVMAAAMRISAAVVIMAAGTLVARTLGAGILAADTLAAARRISVH